VNSFQTSTKFSMLCKFCLGSITAMIIIHICTRFSSFKFMIHYTLNHCIILITASPSLHKKDLYPGFKGHI
jgi:hypothetical protein